MDETSYPLHWPNGWPRVVYRNRSKFGHRGSGVVPMTTALDELERQLRMLGAINTVVSTNVQTRLDGRPYANQKKAADPGAAVYFTLRKKRVVLACDKWLSVEENLYAVAKHIEALRAQERWGVGSVEQAFAGYAALQERTGPSCWEILQISANSTEEQIMAAWRELVKTAHPDAGGSTEAYVALNQAKDIALATKRA
jgi:hypothetical protein